VLNDSGHVLVISHDVIGAHMAGPGIRYYHLARVLSQTFATILAIPTDKPPQISVAGLQIIGYAQGNWSSLEAWAQGARVIIFPSDIASAFPALAQSDAALVVDGYDPLLVEWLLLSQLHPQEQRSSWSTRMKDLTQQYLLGDFFICASERQRDWWLGLLEANGRINPWTFDEDPSLRRLIDVVPYGLAETPPQHTRSAIKGVWLGIGEHDKVILWGGGLWPWFDPLTAIRAMARVWQQRQDVRLIFPGTRHPNPILAQIPTHTEAAQQLASELGLLDRAVFFGDWVPYDDWQNVLQESDLALTLHFEGLETRLAFRSRVLDYFWAGLPTVASRGDVTSDLIAQYDVGVLVDCQDVDAVAKAILRLLDIPRLTWERSFEQARHALTWERAARPLVAFCRNPHRAADKLALGGQVGNPFYVSEISKLQGESQRLQSLVSNYEQRRAVRWANQVHEIKKHLPGQVAKD
jgi:glycosyltransferase involved in cell wall biosynthesis